MSSDLLREQKVIGSGLGVSPIRKWRRQRRLKETAIQSLSYQVSERLLLV
ncbi:hypothetical protein [Nostoc sp. FACHB-888]|nr:hypothetical protein [Nostoc sp. FACHB-888]MBD2244942.1 hypothetical protein [Nostoc sp. FACHB-888]MBW4454420.1 hypothetical protein [Nostoc indistinguendum CM1-VF10]MCC5651095.1 hypothetical protein [Nostoc sp. XA013]